MLAHQDDENTIAHPIGPDTEAVAAFKHEFLNGFHDFITSMDVLVDGRATLNDDWIDHLGREGIGFTVVVTTGVLALLAALGVLGAALVEAVTIPISVVGLIAVFAFNEMRGRQKQAQIKRTEEMLDRDHIDDELIQMANLLVYLHREKLASMPPNAARRLGEKVYQHISNRLLNDASLHFEQLLTLKDLEKAFPQFSPKPTQSRQSALSTSSMLQRLKSSSEPQANEFSNQYSYHPAVRRWRQQRSFMQKVKSFFASIASFFGWQKKPEISNDIEMREIRRPGMFN